MLTRVFDLFAQDDQSLVRSQGGLGIGLTLVRNLVEDHGGSVEARSDGLGLGSEFTVRLPTLETSTSEPPPETPKPPARQVRDILVVDDHSDSAHTLSRVLALWGHNVRVAADGVHGLALAQERVPDLALVDIGLPIMDGYEVARRLRPLVLPNALTLIALTGYGQDDDRRRAREAGFDHHLVKPVDLGELKSLLSRP